MVVVTNRSKVQAYRFANPVQDVNGMCNTVWELLNEVAKVMS